MTSSLLRLENVGSSPLLQILIVSENKKSKSDSPLKFVSLLPQMRWYRHLSGNSSVLLYFLVFVTGTLQRLTENMQRTHECSLSACFSEQLLMFRRH